MRGEVVHEAEFVLYKLTIHVIPSGVFGARNLWTRPVERFLSSPSYYYQDTLSKTSLP